MTQKKKVSESKNPIIQGLKQRDEAYEFWRKSADPRLLKLGREDSIKAAYMAGNQMLSSDLFFIRDRLDRNRMALSQVSNEVQRSIVEVKELLKMTFSVSREVATEIAGLKGRIISFRRGFNALHKIGLKKKSKKKSRSVRQ